MARLTGLSIADVQADRIGTAKRFAAEYNVVVVLKGSRTVIALPDGSIYVNPTGNSGMASAGTGDVLTGIITGLIAQGADVAGAAVAGVFLHGLAGDCAAERLGRHGMLAGDVVDSLPQAIRNLL
jgi:NAD(P)H-hydrate epimerase